MDADTSAPTGADNKLHFLDYWRIIRVRKLVILTVFLLVVLTTTLVTYWLPPTYMSSVSMEIKKDQTNLPKFGPQQVIEGFDPYWIQTQFEIIQSASVLDEVIEKLKLRERWAQRGGQPEPLKLTEAEALLKHSIDPRQIRNTSIVEIRVYSSVKEEAAEIANTIADVYRTRRTSFRERQTKAGLEKLRTQLLEKSNAVVAIKSNIAVLRTNLPLDYITPESVSGAMTIEAEAVRQLEEQYNTFNIRLIGKEKAFAGLTNKTVEQLRSTILIVQPDENLAYLIKQQTQSALDLAAKKATLGSENIDLKKAQSVYDAASKDVDERVKGIMAGMQIELDYLRAQLDALKKSREEAKARNRDTFRKTTEHRDALRDLEQAERIRDTFFSKIIQEEADAELYNSSVVEITAAAQVIDKPVLPKIPLNIALGAFFGLVIGVGLAFFIEYLDTSVKTIDDIERALQTPVLGVIPQNVGFLGDEGPESPNSEAYRILRTNVLFSRKDQKFNTLTVVSGGAGEGKSTTVLNLAVTFAQQGASVLLVDSDLRRPSLHRRLNLSNHLGLTNLLLKQNKIEEVIQTTDVPGLAFLPSGKLPASAMSILNTQQMRDFITEVKRRYDYVFFDSPPIMGVSDASILVSEVDLAIMVIQYRKYPQSMAVRARQMIEKYGHNLLGVVLNNINVSQDAGYYYYGGDYYGYYNKPGRERSSGKAKENGAAAAHHQAEEAFKAERKKSKPGEPEKPELHSKY